MVRPYKCPHCGGTNSIWKGLRPLAEGGAVRIRKCKECGRKYTTRKRVVI